MELRDWVLKESSKVINNEFKFDEDCLKKSLGPLKARKLKFMQQCGFDIEKYSRMLDINLWKAESEIDCMFLEITESNKHMTAYLYGIEDKEVVWTSHGISKRALRALHAKDVYVLKDISKLSEEELLDLPTVGVTAVGKINKILKEHGHPAVIKRIKEVDVGPYEEFIDLNELVRCYLSIAGIKNITDLCNHTREEILSIDGIGPKAISSIDTLLAYNNMWYMDECRCRLQYDERTNTHTIVIPRTILKLISGNTNVNIKVQDVNGTDMFSEVLNVNINGGNKMRIDTYRKASDNEKEIIQREIPFFSILNRMVNTLVVERDEEYLVLKARSGEHSIPGLEFVTLTKEEVGKLWTPMEATTRYGDLGMQGEFVCFKLSDERDNNPLLSAIESME